MSDLHEAIHRVLSYSPSPMAVHEICEHPSIRNFHADGVSENSVATRLTEPDLKGRVWSAYRKNKKYKEWLARPFTEEHRQELCNRKGLLL